MTYDSAFDPDFFLLLRERRATSLAHMKNTSIEVESNILEVNNLRSKVYRDIRKGKSEGSTSSSFATPPQMDEVTKLLKSLSNRMERVELEGRHGYRNPPNTNNRGNFRTPTNSPQTIKRDQRNKDRDDHKL
jgi:hypothetical protein